MRQIAFFVSIGLLSVIIRESPQRWDVSRQIVFQKLLDHHVIDPNRILVHYSHTCDLKIDGQIYPVIDVRELVKNERSPRGYFRIIVFSPDWEVSQSIPYIDERPLSCIKNRLLVYGDISIASLGTAKTGNVIVFQNNGHRISLETVDWISLPTLRQEMQNNNLKD